MKKAERPTSFPVVFVPVLFYSILVADRERDRYSGRDLFSCNHFLIMEFILNPDSIYAKPTRGKPIFTLFSFFI